MQDDKVDEVESTRQFKNTTPNTHLPPNLEHVWGAFRTGTNIQHSFRMSFPKAAEDLRLRLHLNFPCTFFHVLRASIIQD